MVQLVRPLAVHSQELLLVRHRSTVMIDTSVETLEGKRGTRLCCYRSDHRLMNNLARVHGNINVGYNDWRLVCGVQERKRARQKDYELRYELRLV